MKKEMLISAGSAFFGKQWQSELAENLGINSRTIRYWVAGKRKVPSGLESELIAIGEVRKAQIKNAINLLKSEQIRTFSNSVVSETVFTVSENGNLCPEVFNTLQDAEKFIIEKYNEDELYLKQKLNINDYEIGYTPKNLKLLREQYSLTQSDVGKITQTALRTVQNWEAGVDTKDHAGMPHRKWVMLQRHIKNIKENQ